MPPTMAILPTLDSLKDLTRLVQKTEGFHPLVAALKNGHGATLDGAWGSSSALVAAALGLHAPRTLVVVIAFPRDVDGWLEDVASFAGVRPVVFPAWDNLPSDETLLDEIAGQRLRVLRQLEAQEPPRYVLTTIQALTQPVPDRARLAEQRRLLKVKDQIDPDVLAGWLVEHGFKRTEVVELPGEFSRRGSVLDLFSPDSDTPHRLDFFGDEIDSIRSFSSLTQRSSGDPLPDVEVTSAALERPGSTTNGAPRGAHVAYTGHLCDYLPAGAWTVLVEPDDLAEQGKHYLERVTDPRGLFSVPGVFQQLLRFPNARITAMPSPSLEASCHLRIESVERFSGDVTKLRDELDATTAGDRVVIACHNEAESKRLSEVLATGQLAQSDRLRLVTGRVRAGFRMVDAGVAVLSDHELFHREDVRQVLPRRRLESRAIDSFLDLAERRELVGGLLIGKSCLEFILPIAVGRQGDAGLGLAQGLELDHVAGHVEDR